MFGVEYDLNWRKIVAPVSEKILTIIMPRLEGIAAITRSLWGGKSWKK